MSDDYGIFVPGLANKSEYSETHFLEKCRQELKLGFEPGQAWMRLRVAMEYRDSILSQLQREYPQYKFRTYERTSIWIEGDLQVWIDSAIETVKKNFMIVSRVPENHRGEVLKALQNYFPTATFKIGRWFDDEYAIIMNNHDLRNTQSTSK